MGLRIGEPDDLVADYLIRESQVAVDVVERSWFGLDLEHHIETFVLVVDLVGETTTAPLVGLGDGAAGRLDLCRGLVDHPCYSALFKIAIADNHHFIGSHNEHHLPVDPLQRSPVADLTMGQGLTLDRSTLADLRATSLIVLRHHAQGL